MKALRILFITWVLFSLGFIAFAESKKTSSPNVLMIITDDQGFGDLSLHGNPSLKTPHLDRLAKESIQFNRFFVSPVCAPTRASLLTGRYHLRCGVWGVTNGKETMRSEETTLAEALSGAGYRTGIFGKWHNGAHFPNSPEGQGFEDVFGFCAGHWNNYFDTPLHRNGKEVPTKGYISDVIADEALDFIKANRSRPFFCYVPFNAPHSPLQVPNKYFDRFRKMGLDADLAAIYGMCENLDDNIGRLLAGLEKLGLTENTIVIFLTDNGPVAGRFNAGMRGSKGTVHEGGGRVPLFVRWPARFKSPKQIEQIAAHIDLFPTILELCSVSMPKTLPLDGRSLVPLLEGNISSWPKRNLFTHQARGQKIEMYPGAVRSQQYRLVNEGKSYELFDMMADPGQKVNVADKHPEMVRELSQAYEDWFRDVTREGLTRPPIPVGHPEAKEVELPAPEAFFDGGIRFHNKSGFAHDWLTGWTNSDAKIYWELDVANAGHYEVELGYLCATENAGAKIRVKAENTSVEIIVPAAPIKEIPLFHRAETGHRYINREWASLKLGKMKLEKGRTQLTMEVVSKPGIEVMDLDHLILRKLN